MRNSSMKLMGAALLAGCMLLAGCERPPIESVQRGYRGTGMLQVYNPRTLEEVRAANEVPASIPLAPGDSPKATTVYKNVQVLTDLNVAEFTRLMVSITNWVAPKEGCTYCHAGGDFAADTVYAKTVARRMLQMTRHINTDWKKHVAETGVTCYTCHRGQPVPAQVWTQDPGPRTAAQAGNRAEQNAAAMKVGLTSLPYDPFSYYLKGAYPIPVAGDQALPAGNRHSIKETEGTYGLMMHLSQSLGVNCTYCHNSRAFYDWEQSTPQRQTAWYGIRMVRDLNNDYLEPLGPTYPKERLGPLGDAPKANCATCHQGVYKPLFGVSMLKDHPELAGAKP